MKDYLPGQITVIILDNKDLFLDKTIQSVLDQGIKSKHIIVVSSRQEGALSNLQDKGASEVIVSHFAEWNETKIIKHALLLVKTEYACVLRANEPLMSNNALEELCKGFDSGTDVVMVASDLVVVSALGERSHRVNYQERIDLFQYDLLSPEIFKGGGRGIVFRVPVAIANQFKGLDFGLPGMLMWLAVHGRFIHIVKPLISNNQIHTLPKNELKALWQTLNKNIYCKCRKSVWDKRQLKVASFYQNLLAYIYDDRIYKRVFHTVCAKILYPLPWLKKLLRRIVFSGIQGIIHLIAGLGTVGFRIFHVGFVGSEAAQSRKAGVISHVMPPSPSGQSVVLERILRDLSPQEYQLVQTRSSTAREHHIDALPGKVIVVAEKIPAEKFYRNTGLFFLGSILKAFVRGWKIARILQQTKCNVVIGCTGDLFDPPATFFAGLFLKAKTYLYYFDDYRYQWVDRKRRRFSTVFEELFFKSMNGFIVPNEFMQQELLARCFVDTHIVRNPAGDPYNVDEVENNLQRSEKQIVYTGSVYHVNVETIKNVIEALELLARDDIRLHIYSSQSEESMQQYGVCGHYVVYHSHVSPEEISRIQNEADLLLIPFSENSLVPEVIKTSAPGKLGDYLASGTPILACVPDDSFVSWFITKNRCGYVVAANNKESISAVIESILYQDEPQMEVLENAKRVAQFEFDRKKAAREFEKFVLSTPRDEISVLQISATDLGGQQFNGFLLGKALKEKQIHSYMSIAYGLSNSPTVFKYGYGAYFTIINKILRFTFEKLSLQSIFPTYHLRNLFPRKMLEKIDLIHLQLFHAAPFFNLFVISKLGKKFPLVCTVHDQWLYTGHCVHPLECDGWLKGCKKCPDLDRNIPMRHDRAAFMWRLKRHIFHNVNMNLIVSSQWMYDRVKQSPLVSHLPCEIIPFGVDTEVFYPEDKAACRNEFNIPDGHKVIAFRAAPQNIFKGHTYIIEALQNLEHDDDITLLTIDQKGTLDILKDRYNIVDLGWTNDQAILRKAFSAADLFLAPSIAESFGLMPLEAMACGTPVIVFKNTVLEEITHAPQIGIAVDYRNSAALQQAISMLLRDLQKRIYLSEKGAELVREKYSFSAYVSKHAALYRELVSKQ